MEERLYDMIFKRKSFHLFRNVGNESFSKEELEEIGQVWSKLDPLCPEIRTAIRILPGQDTNCKRGEEYCILMYSELKDNYLANIGYLGEQLDLYLVSKDIGTLWFGIGKSDEKVYDGLDFVIMIAIRKIDAASKFRKDMFKSKRKELDEIWKGETIEGVSEIIRFAPSACNSQPWLIENKGEELSVYRYRKAGKRGIMPANMVAFYNRIDMGIILCFLELCLSKKGIEFERKMYVDEGNDEELNLNAVYVLK
ncbi:MAG: nitroreductase [Erysipelotrichaceae bacterium]|nr:nitroreductase [Erysipelotrichaceae bacterium]